MTDQEKETMWHRIKMVRECVHEYKEYGDLNEDSLFEIADSCVPVYTSDLMELAADDLSLAVDEPELGPAFDGSPTPVNIIAANVFEKLYAEAREEYNKVMEAKEEAEDEEEE